MRPGLNAMILPCFFNFRQSVEAVTRELRRRRFGLGRFSGDPRAPVFRVECLAKIARLRFD